MKKQNRVPKTVRTEDATFVYTSTCCSASAKKPACVIAKGQIVGVYAGAKPEGEASLGTWRCSGCGKSCKVVRSNKPRPQEVDSK